MPRKKARPRSLSALATLERSVQGCTNLWTRVNFHTVDRDAPIEVLLTGGSDTVTITAMGKKTRKLKLPIQLWGDKSDMISFMEEMVARLPEAKVDIESGLAQEENDAIDNQELARQVVAAWCQVCEQAIPTTSEFRAAERKRRTASKGMLKELLQELQARPPADESEFLSPEYGAECQRWRDRVAAIWKALPPNVTPSLAGARLAGANLCHLSLSRFDLSRCHLRGADLRGVFGLSDFSNANLRQANLTKAHLGHARFEDTVMDGSCLNAADLLGCQLIRTSLKKADLCGANLDRATLENVNWDGAIFDEKTRFPVGFTIPAELKWAGQGKDPRATRPPHAPRKAPKRLTPQMLLSDNVLASRCDDIEHDPQLPDNVVLEAADGSVCDRELRFSILLEYLPHRLADLKLSQLEIDFNAWYRCERFAQMHDRAEGGYCEGNHSRAEQFTEAVWSQMDEEVFMKLMKRIQREVKKLVGKR